MEFLGESLSHFLQGIGQIRNWIFLRFLASSKMFMFIVQPCVIEMDWHTVKSQLNHQGVLKNKSISKGGVQQEGVYN